MSSYQSVNRINALKQRIETETGGTYSTLAEGVQALIDMGGGTASVSRKDVNFIDYDGTILHSYTVEEASALTALPNLPSHEGLICQGWNWTLSDIKTLGRAVDVGAMYITDDGKTRVYIHLEEGRTSPMLGCCPKGTVTVDWGDGTGTDVLTGTHTMIVQWTPKHEYSAPGDYVISLTVDGRMGLDGSSTTDAYSSILRYSSSADVRNAVYQNSVQKVEIGSGVTLISANAFYSCTSMSNITIPNSVTSIGGSAFNFCTSLSGITIPNRVTSIDDSTFGNCVSLSSITIPNSVTSMGSYAFSSCVSLSSITIPNSVTSIGNFAFYYCRNLSNITIPDSVTSINDNAFNGCWKILNIVFPDGVTSIRGGVIRSCKGIANVVFLGNVTSVGTYAFADSGGVRYYDFTHNTAVPTLSATNAFNGIAADCEIRVPSALADEWKAATNWATYADYIVGV